jgi:hypothetical protein
LFEEPRIKTFYVDQTDPETFKSLSTQLNSKFHLIIDDGLHSPNGNLATPSFACDHLQEGGWFIIEDIGTAAMPLWRVVSALLPENYNSWIIVDRDWLLFAIKRRKSQTSEDYLRALAFDGPLEKKSLDK